MSEWVIVPFGADDTAHVHVPPARRQSSSKAYAYASRKYAESSTTQEEAESTTQEEVEETAVDVDAYFLRACDARTAAADTTASKAEPQTMQQATYESPPLTSVSGREEPIDVDSYFEALDVSTSSTSGQQRLTEEQASSRSPTLAPETDDRTTITPTIQSIDLSSGSTSFNSSMSATTSSIRRPTASSSSGLSSSSSISMLTSSTISRPWQEFDNSESLPQAQTPAQAQLRAEGNSQWAVASGGSVNENESVRSVDQDGSVRSSHDVSSNYNESQRDESETESGWSWESESSRPSMLVRPASFMVQTDSSLIRTREKTEERRLSQAKRSVNALWDGKRRLHEMKHKAQELQHGYAEDEECKTDRSILRTRSRTHSFDERTDSSLQREAEKACERSRSRSRRSVDKEWADRHSAMVQRAQRQKQREHAARRQEQSVGRLSTGYSWQQQETVRTARRSDGGFTVGQLYSARRELEELTGNHTDRGPSTGRSRGRQRDGYSRQQIHSARKNLEHMAEEAAENERRQRSRSERRGSIHDRLSRTHTASSFVHNKEKRQERSRSLKRREISRRSDPGLNGRARASLVSTQLRARDSFTSTSFSTRRGSASTSVTGGTTSTVPVWERDYSAYHARKHESELDACRRYEKTKLLHYDWICFFFRFSFCFCSNIASSMSQATAGLDQGG